MASPLKTVLRRRARAAPRALRARPLRARARAARGPRRSRLDQLVAAHGCKKWALISTFLPGKVAKQCRRRWQNHLNHLDAKQGGWTAEEARAAPPARPAPAPALARATPPRPPRAGRPACHASRSRAR